MPVHQIKSEMFMPMLEEELESLPDVEFDDKVDEVSSAVDGIGNAVEFRLDMRKFRKHPEREKVIATEVARIYQSLKTNPQYTHHFSVLNKLSSDLGSNIATVFSTLRNKVRPDVEMLEKAIEGKTQEIVDEVLDGTPIDEAGNNKEENDKQDGFEVVQWRQYYSVLGGEDQIVEEIKEEIGYEPEPQDGDTQTAVESTDLNTEDIPLDAETEEDVKSRVDVAINTPEESEHVEAALKMVTDKYEFQRAVHYYILGSLHTNNYMEQARRCMYLLKKLYPCFRIIKNTPLNVSTSLLTKIHANLDACHRLCVLAGQVLRTIQAKYKNALVMDYDTVNGDNIEDFTDDGGTMEDITMHLRARYKSKHIPVAAMGISAKTIMEDKDQVAQECAEADVEQQEMMASLQHQATARAMSMILRTYLESVSSDDLPDDTSVDDFVEMKKHLIQTANNRLSTDRDSNLESVLYDFVIDVWHGGTPVQMAHKLFGEEMVRQMKADPQLTDETIKLVDATVGARIVSSFLFNKILK